MILTAQAIGITAHQSILEDGTYTVHSSFQKGFNIVDHTGTLIFIGTDENGTFPFGIVVDAYTRDTLLQHIRVGQTLSSKQQRLHIDTTYQLDCRVTVLPTLQDFERADVQALRQVVAQYDYTMYENTVFEQSKMAEMMHCLQDDTADATPYFHHVIGRGQGLTPTGDDILTGILYVHYLTPFIKRNHFKNLATCLNGERTTLVSETFLKHALRGLFSSSIAMLQYEATVERVNRLLTVGSSSGRDTLYGIYVALTLRSGEHG